MKTRWSRTIAEEPYVAQSLGLGAFLSDDIIESRQLNDTLTSKSDKSDKRLRSNRTDGIPGG